MNQQRENAKNKPVHFESKGIHAQAIDLLHQYNRNDLEQFNEYSAGDDDGISPMINAKRRINHESGPMVNIKYHQNHEYNQEIADDDSFFAQQVDPNKTEGFKTKTTNFPTFNR